MSEPNEGRQGLAEDQGAEVAAEGPTEPIAAQSQEAPEQPEPEEDEFEGRGGALDGNVPNAAPRRLVRPRSRRRAARPSDVPVG